MAKGQTSWALASWTKVLALFAIAPTLLLGPALGTDALLLHAHGMEGEHFHVVPPQASEHHDHHAVHHEFEEPAAEHHGQQSGRHPSRSDSPAASDEAKPEGLRFLISFPGPVHLSSVSSAPLLRPASTLVLGLAAEPRVRNRVDAPAFVGTGPPGRAQPAKERSGVAAVLATSCAVLI